MAVHNNNHCLVDLSHEWSRYSNMRYAINGMSFLTDKLYKKKALNWNDILQTKYNVASVVHSSFFVNVYFCFFRHESNHMKFGIFCAMLACEVFILICNLALKYKYNRITNNTIIIDGNIGYLSSAALDYEVFDKQQSLY